MRLKSSVINRPIKGFQQRASPTLSAASTKMGGVSDGLFLREPMDKNRAREVVEIANKAREKGRVDSVETDYKTEFSRKLIVPRYNDPYWLVVSMGGKPLVEPLALGPLTTEEHRALTR